MGQCVTKPVILTTGDPGNEPLDRARTQSEGARSRMISVSTAALVNAEKFQIALDPEAEFEIMEAMMKRFKRQTVVGFIACLLMVVGSVTLLEFWYFYSWYNIVLYVCYASWLISTVMFCWIGYENAREMYKAAEVGVITPQQISSLCCWIAGVCFVVGMCIYDLSSFGCVALYEVGTGQFMLSGFIDTWIWWQEKRLAGFDDMIWFDKWMLAVESLPFMLSNVGNVMFVWDMVYWYPNFIDKYYSRAVWICLYACVLYTLAMLSGLFLVFGQERIGKWREAAVERALKHHGENLRKLQKSRKGALGSPLIPGQEERKEGVDVVDVFGNV
mmetsp:Transcript_40666/g.72267  ORF Transcript_40666/g.72267 Transcript_40666/m.72267 type:complete len:330 (+) Transcript_40666:55-1044(+)